MNVYTHLLIAALAASASANRWNTMPDQDQVTSLPIAAPNTLSPVTPSPVTPSPVTTPPPVTRAPVTFAPVTSTPATTSPITNAPVSAAPDTASPVTATPTTAAPITASPTASPIFTACRLDMDGSYADVNGEDIQLAEFEYAIETEGGSTTQEEIIKELEIAFATYILPIVFDEDCNGIRRRLRRLAPVGLSTTPLDVIMMDDTMTSPIECGIELQDGSDCYVVDGKFTIFTDGADTDEVTDAISGLSEACSAGIFNDIHPDLINVVIVNDDPSGITGPGEGGNDDSVPPASTGPPVALLVGAIAVGSLLLVGAAAVYRRKKNQANVDQDSTVMTPGETPAPVPPPADAVYDMNELDNNNNNN